MNRITAVHLLGPIIPSAAVASLAIGNVLLLLMFKAGVLNYLTSKSRSLTSCW